MKNSMKNTIVALSIGLVLSCVGGPFEGPQTSEPRPDTASSGNETGGPCDDCGAEGEDPDAGTCNGRGAVCETLFDTLIDPCCPGTRCIENTVYDYWRCDVPRPAGRYCYLGIQCASGHCEMSSCTE